MAESYRDRWQTAAFRNIEFLTDSHDAKGGRRLVVHEFPGAEVPLVEDLGGKAWDYSLNAYFIGDQYDQDADAFITELNRPGAEWLIHPWLGRLWVRARSWSRREANNEQGFCTVTIEFVPGGEQPATPTQDKTDIANAAIGDLADSALGDFDLLAMGAEGLALFTEAVQGGLEFVRNAISFSALPMGWAQTVLTGIAGFKNDIATLSGVPGQYSAMLNSLVNSVGLGADEHDLPATDRPRLVARLAQLSTRPAYAVTGLTALETTTRINLTAEHALQSRLFLVAAMQVALADFTTEADRADSLQSVDAAYEALLPTLPDAVFQAAVTARTALIEAVMAQDLKPQVIKDVVSPLPSTVLAHRLQIDEAVLIARNKVRHPLFVQGRVYG